MSLGGRSKTVPGFPGSRTGEPHNRGLCLKGSCSLQPASDLDLGHWENFFQTCVVPGLDTLGAQGRLRGGPLGRGCRPGVQACGCVHERGPGATHTHTHTLTRPHPLRALGRAAHVSRTSTPTSGPPGSRARGQVHRQSLLTNAAGRIRGPERGAMAGSPHRPAVPARPGKGTGRGCPGLLPLRQPSADGSARWVPPRHVGRAGGDADGGRAGRGHAAELPRPAAGPRPGRAPPQPPSAAGAPWDPVLPGWRRPSCASDSLGKLLFQLCTRRENRRGPHPTRGGS